MLWWKKSSWFLFRFVVRTVQTSLNHTPRWSLFSKKKLVWGLISWCLSALDVINVVGHQTHTYKTEFRWIRSGQGQIALKRAKKSKPLDNNLLFVRLTHLTYSLQLNPDGFQQILVQEITLYPSSSDGFQHFLWHPNN